MATPIYPNQGTDSLMGTIRTALANCTIDLFQNNYTVNAGTVPADLTVATFSGYAQKVVVALLGVYHDPAGGSSAQIATQQFDHNGGATANMIYGFYAREAGGDLILAGNFDAPIPMSALGDAIPLDIKFNFGN